MKKFLIYLCVVAMLFSTMILGASAISSDVEASAFEDLEMMALIYQSGSDVSSDYNDDYWGYWWEGDVPEVDSYLTACTVNMRGFDMSPDGRYMYCGTLNGGTGVRGVVVLDTATGEVTDLYEKYDGEAGLEGSPFSYAKGIATDDRGYVYVGFAFSLNYNVVNLGIAKQNDDGTLEEVSFDSVYAFGDPGDQGGIKVGVNGVDVAKVGDKYYCYVMTNYSHDALYCLDVTDPTNPKLNKDFGDNGVIDFAYDDCPVALDGFTLDEGQYMDVDDDGVIWLVANAKEGKDGIMRIAPDGSSCLGVIEASGAYCVEHEGGFLLVGAKNAKTVTVLDDASFETLATVTLPDGYGDRVTRIRIVEDILYVCFAGNDNNNSNAIMAAPLTPDAELLLADKAAALSPEEETNAETEGETIVGTQPADTAAPTIDETNAETDTLASTQEEQGTSSSTNMTPNDKEEGCASVMGVSAVVPMLLAAAWIMVKKQKE